MLKLVLGLQRSEATPNAQLRLINPHVAGSLSGKLLCGLPTQAMWKALPEATRLKIRAMTARDAELYQEAVELVAQRSAPPSP